MKKLLPPLLFVLFVLLMGLVCWAFEFKHNVLFPFNLIGIPFLLGGVIHSTVK